MKKPAKSAKTTRGAVRKTRGERLGEVAKANHDTIKVGGRPVHPSIAEAADDVIKVGGRPVRASIAEATADDGVTIGGRTVRPSETSKG